MSSQTNCLFVLVVLIALCQNYVVECIHLNSVSAVIQHRNILSPLLPTPVFASALKQRDKEDNDKRKVQPKQQTQSPKEICGRLRDSPFTVKLAKWSVIDIKDEKLKQRLIDAALDDDIDDATIQSLKKEADEYRTKKASEEREKNRLARMNNPLWKTFDASFDKFSRLPVAVKLSASSGVASFCSGMISLTPMAGVLNIGLIGRPKEWIKKSVLTGADWARVSAYYTAGETFFRHVRQKDDRLNAHLASGMSSALFRVKDGPIGMTQGFAIGYAFMYMIDNVLGKSRFQEKLLLESGESPIDDESSKGKRFFKSFKKN